MEIEAKERVEEPAGIAQQWPSLLLIKLGRITMHRFTEALAPYGMRPRHLAALIELRDHGELTQQSLCSRLHVDPTNLVEILNELEERGYASRRRDPEDRRRHRVEVSKKGLAVIEKVSAAMDLAEAEMLSGFEGDDREEFERLLATVWGGVAKAYAQIPADADLKAS